MVIIEGVKTVGVVEPDVFGGTNTMCRLKGE